MILQPHLHIKTVLSNKIRSNSKLAADELYSPNYFPRNSYPYSSSQSSSHHQNTSTQHYSSSSNQKNQWPSSEMSYTSQIIQQQQQQQRPKNNNITKRSIHSNSSVRLKNKSFIDHSGLFNT